jgi:predicted transglutaminase-like cysteine proteinase
MSRPFRGPQCGPVAQAWLSAGRRLHWGAWLLLAWATVGSAGDATRMLDAAQKVSPQAYGAVQALLEVLATQAGQSEGRRLQAINDFYNQRLQFRTDQAIWGVLDYWASPIETLARGQGDCEDYAIAKYFSLLHAGVAPARLRLVYVRALVEGASQAHMVLAYFEQPQADPLILDNLQATIRPASQRPDLTPVFSFNSQGLWQGASGAPAGDAAARLSPWREVLRKAREEGF